VGVVDRILNLLNDHDDDSWEAFVALQPKWSKLIGCPPRSGTLTLRRVQRRLDRDQTDALIAAYRSGKKINSLASDFGIARTTVMSVLDRERVERRRLGLDAQDLPEVAHLYTEGWSAARLGEKFGADPATVLRRLREHGVAIRPRRGWQHPGDEGSSHD
jgi:DNA-directed RNA polymerase specialized sigma24 family protein